MLKLNKRWESILWTVPCYKKPLNEERLRVVKLTFLGTSHGIPEKNRFCTCNMLELGGDIYIFDAGAPLTELLTNRDIPYEKVRKLFITHCHLDHMNGMEMFLRLCKWHVADSRAEGYLPDKRVTDKINESLQTVDKTTRICISKFIPILKG